MSLDVLSRFTNQKERCVMANQPTPSLTYPPPEIAGLILIRAYEKPLVYLTVMFGHIIKPLFRFGRYVKGEGGRQVDQT